MTTGMKRLRRWSSRSMRARSWSASGTMRLKASRVAPTSLVSSAISTARQLSLLPATTAPNRSSTRPRGGAIRRELIRLVSAKVA